MSSRLSQVMSKSTVVMFSAEGASFQEWALRKLDLKGSVAHQSIGKFVTAINNSKMTIGDAERAFVALLGK